MVMVIGYHNEICRKTEPSVINLNCLYLCRCLTNARQSFYPKSYFRSQKKIFIITYESLLNLFNLTLDEDLISTEIAYIYQIGDTIAYSDNIHDIIPFRDVSEIMSDFTQDYGKFVYKHQTYYYYTLHNNNVTKIALNW